MENHINILFLSISENSEYNNSILFERLKSLFYTPAKKDYSQNSIKALFQKNKEIKFFFLPQTNVELDYVTLFKNLDIGFNISFYAILIILLILFIIIIIYIFILKQNKIKNIIYDI